MEAGRLALTAARPGSKRERLRQKRRMKWQDGRRGCDDGVPVLELRRRAFPSLGLACTSQESEREPLELLAAYGIHWGWRRRGPESLIATYFESMEEDATA